MTTLEKMTAKATAKQEILQNVQYLVDSKQRDVDSFNRRVKEKKEAFKAGEIEGYESFEEYIKDEMRWEQAEHDKNVAFLAVYEEVVKELFK